MDFLKEVLNSYYKEWQNEKHKHVERIRNTTTAEELKKKDKSKNKI